MGESEFIMGVKHITDLEGYDHMLFLLALSAGYGFKEWKQLLWMVTAFTIGHATTLIIAGLGAFHMSSNWVEFCIALTIFSTAVIRLTQGGKPASQGIWGYVLIVFFGLIHGVGFSSFFRMMISNDADIVMPLFLFNLGVEAGQILILLILLLISAGILAIIRLKPSRLAIVYLSVAALLSAVMVWERLPWKD
ncbi:MAG: hypothetical protein RL220_1659 [Bacteroidota bacterium]